MTADEVLAAFREAIWSGKLKVSNTPPGQPLKGREYSCKNKFKRWDTVDGNPTVAEKMCHPYIGNKKPKSNDGRKA